MNMFKKVNVKSVAGYIASVPEERRQLIATLHAFIKRTVPSLRSYFAFNMLGYGTFTYKNYKKELIEWPIIALANQKQYISIYVCCIIDGKYVAERYKKDLGKVSVGRSCIRFKKLDDINLPILKKVLKEAAQHPGLTQV